MQIGLNLKLSQPVPGTTALGPRLYFQNGEQGVWYQPKDFSTLFQDAAGTTPVTAVEQPVGLMLDKRLGLVPGSELVNFASFPTPSIENFGGSNGTWTAATKTISNTVLSTNSSYPRFLFDFGLVAGKWYVVSGRFTGDLTAIVQMRLATSGTASDLVYNSTTGVFSGTVIASNQLQIHMNGTLAVPKSVSIQSLSIRELPGNHAYTPAAASTSRPTVSARYSLLTYSEQFDNAAWTKSQASVTADAVIAPNGTLTADKLIDSTSSTEHGIYSSVTIANNVYSVYAKAADLSVFYFRFRQSTGQALSVAFDLANGTVCKTTNQGTYYTTGTGSIESVGNGWYRCAVTVVCSSLTSNVFLSLANTNNPTFNTNGEYVYTGDGVNGVYLWGADLRVSNDGVGLPVYQRVAASTDYDTAGFPIYLRADGSNDYMLTNSIDFGAGATNAPLGSELVTNGNFATDSDWTKGTGWTISGGVATTAAGGSGSLDQAISLSSGKFYRIEYTITGWVAGQVQPGFSGGSTVLGPLSGTGNGTRVCYIAAVSGNNTLRIFKNASADSFSIDNVSVKELLDSSLAPDKMTVVAGVRKLSDAALGVVAELSATSATNAGSFLLSAPRTTATADYGFRSAGSTLVDAVSATTFASPITNVLAGTGNISGDSVAIYVNGALSGSSTGDQGTGNFGNYPLYLFSRAGTSLFYNGRFTGLIVRGAQSNATDLAAMTAYINADTKAY